MASPIPAPESAPSVPSACDDVARADLSALARALVEAALEARDRVLDAQATHALKCPARRPTGRASEA